MEIYKKILKLAIEGKLPNNISEDDFPDIDIFVELYQRGFIDTIDASSLDGKAYLNPKITFEGREYYDSLERTPNRPMNTNKNKTKKVFISYVRENSDEVDRICKKFTEEGISYWIDRENIEPGKLWKTAIKDAISNGAYFLACFSKEYAGKSETHMNEEILVAIDILRKKPFNSGWFIPIKLSECEIPAIDIGAGNTLQDIHHLKFYEDWDTEIERLVDIIKREEEKKKDDSKKHYDTVTEQILKLFFEAGRELSVNDFIPTMSTNISTIQYHFDLLLHDNLITQTRAGYESSWTGDNSPDMYDLTPSGRKYVIENIGT